MTHGEYHFKDLKGSPQKMRRVHLYQVVEGLKELYSVASLCAYLGFPRSSYYLWLKNGRPDYKRFDADLTQKITDIFQTTQKGYRFICYQLKRQYLLVRNPKTIWRYMRLLSLKSLIRKKRYHSCTQREINEKARHVHHNVLARNFKSERPLFPKSSKQLQPLYPIRASLSTPLTLKNPAKQLRFGVKSFRD